MLDFELSDEQKQLQEMTRKFVKDEIIPKAAHHDETGDIERRARRRHSQVRAAPPGRRAGAARPRPSDLRRAPGRMRVR